MLSEAGDFTASRGAFGAGATARRRRRRSSKILRQRVQCQQLRFSVSIAQAQFGGIMRSFQAVATFHRLLLSTALPLELISGACLALAAVCQFPAAPALAAQIDLAAVAKVSSVHIPENTNPRDYAPQTLLHPGKSGDAVTAAANAMDFDPPTNAASAVARAGYGWLQANDFANVTSQPPLGSLAAHADVAYGAETGTDDNGNGMHFFKDGITISSAGLDGQNGELTVTLNYSTELVGLLGGPNIGSAAQDRSSTNVVVGFTAISGTASGGLVFTRVFYQSYQNIDETLVEQGTTVSGAGIDYDGNLVPSFAATFDIPFVFGQAFAIGAYMETSAGAGVSPPSLSPSDPNYAFDRTAQAGVETSLSWGGISSVTLQPAALLRRSLRAQAIVTDYTLTSFSGADYLNSIAGPLPAPVPVPEPGTYAQMLVGFGLLGFVAGRRKRLRACTAGPCPSDPHVPCEALVARR